MEKDLNVFHSLFKERNMKILEWISMLVLDKEYCEIRGKVKIKKLRFNNQESVDLIVELDDKTIVIELNNYLLTDNNRILYIINDINNKKIVKERNFHKQVQGILVNFIWDDFKNKNNVNEIIYEYPMLGNDYLLKIVNVNILYYLDKDYSKLYGLDKLAKLLTINNSEEFLDTIVDEKLLKNYYKRMYIDNMTDIVYKLNYNN